MTTTETQRNGHCLSMLIGKWERIVVQGGKLRRAPRNSEYLLSGIWIFVRSKWIGLTSIEFEDDEYGIEQTVLESPPIPEPSKLNRPPRMAAESFPDDCRLDYLQTAGASQVETSGAELTASRPRFPYRIVVVSKNGDQFEFKASRKYPENIELRMLKT